MPVGGRLNRNWDFGLAVHQAQQETWGLGEAFAWLRDSDGIAKRRRVVESEWRIRRQMGGASLCLAVPVALLELEPFSVAPSYPRLDDAWTRWGAGLGDLRLGLRWDAAGRAWDALLHGELSAPSGEGPFQAAQPLVATGSGRWALHAGGGAGLHAGAWQLRAAVRASLQLGRAEDVKPATPLAYDGDGPVYAPLSGPLWLNERWGADAALGLGWDWFVDADSRHSLTLSLLAVQTGPLRMEGREVAGSAAQGLALQPELHARYGDFAALGAWRSAWLWARGLPAADFGELFLRLDYAL
jgi:hypothetical protein